AMTVSIPDLRAQLSFPSITLQAEAFSSLVLSLKSSKDAKERGDLIVLFWDCLSLYGPVVSRWTCSSIDELVEEGILPRDESLIRDCLRGISDQSFIGRKEIVRTILRHAADVLKAGLEIQTICVAAADDVIDVMMERGLQQDELLSAGCLLGMRDRWSDIPHPYLSRIEWNEERIDVMEDILDVDSLWRAVVGRSEEKRETQLRFIAHLPSSSLLSLDLTSICPIQLGSLLSQYPQLVMNDSLQPHPALLPGLLEICGVERELAKVPCGGASVDVNNKAKKLVVLSQQIGNAMQKRGREEEGKKEEKGLSGIVKWLIEDEKRLKQWMDRGIKVDFVPSIDTLCTLSALLPYASKSCPDETMKLLVSIAERSSGLANTVFLLCLTLLTRSWIEGIERRKVMETIAGTVTHRTMVSPVLKILSMMCQSASDRIQAIDLMGGIVERYPTSIGELLSPLTSISESDDIEWAREKLKLIKRICVASDESDAHLSTMTELLKKGGRLMGSTVEVVTELCRMEELQLTPVAAQIREKTKNGLDIEALAAFVTLLAAAATVEEEEEIQAKFASEISTFISNPSTVVRTAAWRALAQFPIGLVIVRKEEEEVSVVMQKSLERFKPEEADDEEKKAFTELLHAMLQVDVEELPRPLYTTRAVREDDLLSSLLPLLIPSLSSLDSLTTLCLFRPICNGQPQDKRLQYSLSLYRTLLAQSTMPEDGRERLRWMAGWRDATKSILFLLEPTLDESGGDARALCRERINDELKRSLISSSSSLPTVCVVLTTLIGLGRGEGEVSTFSSFFSSAVTFIQMATDDKFKPRIQPIFQVSISSCIRSPSFTRSLLSLISISSPPSLLSFFDLPIGKKEDCHWLAFDGIPKKLIDRLMGSSSEKLCESVSVTDVRLIAAALGVDSVTVEIVEDEMERREDNEIGRKIEECNGEKDIEDIFSLFCSLSMSLQQEWRPRLKRRMERIARDGKDSIHLSLLRSLSFYSLLIASLNSSRSHNLPSNYDYLPKGSLLKIIMESILASGKIENTFPMVASLVGVKRKDARFLPPIDCSFLLPYEIEHGDTVLRIIVQQGDLKQLYRILSLWSDRGSNKCSREEMRGLGESMGMIVNVMEERIIGKVVEMLMEASKSDETLLDFVVPLMECNIVHDTVLSSLRPLNTVFDLDQLILRKFKGFQRTDGRLGWLFEALVESCRCDINSMKKLVEILKGRGSMWKNGAASVLLFSISSRSATEIGEKIVEILNVVNLTRNERGDRRETLSHLWEILTVFILAARSESIHFPLWKEDGEIPHGLNDLMRRAINRYLRGISKEKTSLSAQIAIFATECLDQMLSVDEESKFTSHSLLVFIRLLIKFDRSHRLQQSLIRSLNWNKICEV
ncbi:hypothetical protein PFISCL1PPCAC_1752, partial [Pristionchus fissidentatus]